MCSPCIIVNFIQRIGFSIPCIAEDAKTVVIGLSTVAAFHPSA
jgi:hypothetical protein